MTGDLEGALTEISCRPQLRANWVFAAELLVAPVGVGQPFAMQLDQLVEAFSLTVRSLSAESSPRQLAVSLLTVC